MGKGVGRTQLCKVGAAVGASVGALVVGATVVGALVVGGAVGMVGVVGAAAVQPLVEPPD